MPHAPLWPPAPPFTSSAGLPQAATFVKKELPKEELSKFVSYFTFIVRPKQ